MARPLRRFRAKWDRALCGICVLLAAAALSGQTTPRARALGVPFTGTPGPLNAITDVPGVEVGHTTLVRGDGALVVGQGPVRTGVTAIWPRGKRWAPVFAGWFAGNGFGEMTGAPWVVEGGVLARMARASAVEVMRLDYVTHARAKGLPESRVLARHVLPNAFGPTWTLIGLVLGNLLGGIAVLETVFTIPGLGRLLVDAIFNRDYPVIQGCLLLTAGIYVLVNLVVDLCYPLFDPRVTAR
jgi:hypothetical protein